MLDTMSKDVAYILARHVGNFFPLSSINRKFRGFFQALRQTALKKVKIFVKENGNSSFMLTFEGKLYACGQNKQDHFGLGDSKEKERHKIKCYKQWISIGPPGKRISEVILAAENSVFVRCDKEWFGAGTHPYIQQSQYGKKELSSWVTIAGPEPFSIVELIPTEYCIFIRGRDGLAYIYGWDFENKKMCEKSTSSKIYWKKINCPVDEMKRIIKESENKLKLADFQKQSYPRRNSPQIKFIQKPDGWYGEGEEDENGILGIGYPSFLDEPQKLNCYNKKILKLVYSPQHVFADCEDGWYFTGCNSSGQNGMNDTQSSRWHWVKILSHGEDIEHAIISSDLNEDNKSKELKSLRFGKTLQKCRDFYFISIVENISRHFTEVPLRMCYHPDYEDKYRFYFFLPNYNAGLLSCFEEDEIKAALREMFDDHLIYLWWDSYLEGTFPWHLSEHPPFPTEWVIFSVENYAGIGVFLENYEKMLDAYEQKLSEQKTNLSLHKFQ